MVGATIMLWERNPKVRSGLADALTERGYHIVQARLDEIILSQVELYEPDVLFLDDLSLCAQIRQRWRYLPIFLVEAKRDHQHVVQALDQGADDYVTTPFALGELTARIRALLRRTQQKRSVERDGGMLSSRDGYLVLDVTAHQVLVGGQAIHLTHTEFALLQFLMSHADRVLTHRFLLQRCWGTAYGTESSYVRIYVNHLRNKIEPDPSHPRYLLTELGVGYVFRTHNPGEEESLVRQEMGACGERRVTR